MERRGQTPPGGITAVDLRPLLEARGPFATVMLETNRTTENAGIHWEQRWRAVRRDLLDAGATEQLVSHLDQQIPDAHRHGDVFYAIANEERAWIATHFAERAEGELVRVASLPVLAPFLAQRQLAIPHIVALVDREGADVATMVAGDDRHDTITGATGPAIRRTAPGGWSQKRYQHRAEVEWSRTAREIANELAATADRTHAEVIVMAGDVREVQLVLDDLPEPIRARTHLVAGGRAAGTDEAARGSEVARFVSTAAAEQSVDLLRKLREEIGQQDRAAVGADSTLDALNRSQVEVLLVHDDPDDDRIAWFGSELVPIAAQGERNLIADPQEGRLIDVAIRAAIGSGADIRVVPKTAAMADGLAAILRWADAHAR